MGPMMYFEKKITVVGPFMVEAEVSNELAATVHSVGRYSLLNGNIQHGRYLFWEEDLQQRIELGRLDGLLNLFR
jgi:hypothetical protein